ncbi:hypothetical protein J9332_37340, partial [Aquimarina celericrescens]|nr:hypothetical protein [Aquimarina celericrescens]
MNQRTKHLTQLILKVYFLCSRISQKPLFQAESRNLSISTLISNSTSQRHSVLVEGSKDASLHYRFVLHDNSKPNTRTLQTV